ncbi:HlyD family secretion protein [Hydrogenimonas sp.]
MKIRFDSQPAAPDEQRGVKIPYPPEKRQAPVWRWYLLLLLFLSPILYFGWTLLVPLVRIEAPGYLRIESYTVAAPRSGWVRALKVRDHSEVKEGEPLLRIEDESLEAAIDATRKEMERLRRMSAEELSARVAAAAAETTALKRSEAAARKRWERLRDLRRLGATTESEVTAALTAYEKARRDLAAARAAYEALLARERAGGSPEVVGLEARLERLTREEASLLLRSPVNGIVENVEAREGSFVERGAHLLDILKKGEPRVTAYFSPKYFDRLRKGRRVTVRFADGYAIDGEVAETPIVSTRLPADFTVLKEHKRAVLAKVRFLSPLPPGRRVANLPVTVILDKGPSALLQRLMK